MPPGCLPGEVFRACPSRIDQGHAGDIISLGCLGNILMSPQRSWWVWLGRGTSGTPCLSCCPCVAMRSNVDSISKYKFYSRKRTQCISKIGAQVWQYTIWTKKVRYESNTEIHLEATTLLRFWTDVFKGENESSARHPSTSPGNNPSLMALDAFLFEVLIKMAAVIIAIQKPHPL